MIGSLPVEELGVLKDIPLDSTEETGVGAAKEADPQSKKKVEVVTDRGVGIGMMIQMKNVQAAGTRIDLGHLGKMQIGMNSEANRIADSQVLRMMRLEEDLNLLSLIRCITRPI